MTMSLSQCVDKEDLEHAKPQGGTIVSHIHFTFPFVRLISKGSARGLQFGAGDSADRPSQGRRRRVTRSAIRAPAGQLTLCWGSRRERERQKERRKRRPCAGAKHARSEGTRAISIEPGKMTMLTRPLERLTQLSRVAVRALLVLGRPSVRSVRFGLHAKRPESSGHSLRSIRDCERAPLGAGYSARESPGGFSFKFFTFSF